MKLIFVNYFYFFTIILLISPSSQFYIETVGETLTLISLDYLEKPTIVKLTDEIEAKWEI